MSQQQSTAQPVEVDVNDKMEVQQFEFGGRIYRVKWELKRTQIPDSSDMDETSPTQWVVYILWTYDGYLVRLGHYIPDDLWFVREVLGFGVDQLRP